MKQLRNYMEDAVQQYLFQWLSEMDVCHCEECQLDIAAIMLNRLKPHYGVTETGAMYAQLRDFSLQYRADIMAALSYAVEIVRERPHHDRT